MFAHIRDSCTRQLEVTIYHPPPRVVKVSISANSAFKPWHAAMSRLTISSRLIVSYVVNEQKLNQLFIMVP